MKNINVPVNREKDILDAQLIFDAQAKEPKQLFKGYAVHGNTYVPIGDTVGALPSGRYGFQFTMDGVYPYLKNISLENVIMLPNPIYKKVLDDLTAFWGQSAEYKKHGFIPRRGILLHGNPGTGKSCLLQVVADKLITDHDGLVFDVFSESDLRGFMGVANAIRSVEPNRKIVCLLEDGDNLIYGNKASSPLLNLLDGSAKINDIAYIMTTNYYSQLPDNIKNRPSRFNRKYEILNPTDTERQVFLEKKFPKLDEKAVKLIVANSHGFTIDALKELVLSTEVLKMSMDEALAEIKGQFTFTFDESIEAERDLESQQLKKAMTGKGYDTVENFNHSEGTESIEEKSSSVAKLRDKLSDSVTKEGKGKGNEEQGTGGTDVCKCPKCGEEVPHERDVPCAEVKCPKCGTLMEGKDCNCETPIKTTVKRRTDTSDSMKEQVEKLLIKNGNNPDDVKKMVKEHFKEAAKNYKTASKIAEYIRTVY